MEVRQPLSAHQRLPVFGMVARLESAIHFAMAHDLAAHEAWLRDSRDYLKFLIEYSGQEAIRFIPLIEPQLADFEKAASAIIQGQ